MVDALYKEVASCIPIPIICSPLALLSIFVPPFSGTSLPDPLRVPVLLNIKHVNYSYYKASIHSFHTETIA